MLKEKRKANGNLTRRPPARLIAIYKVFKVSLKPFQRLGGVRGGSPDNLNHCAFINVNRIFFCTGCFTAIAEDDAFIGDGEVD